MGMTPFQNSDTKVCPQNWNMIPFSEFMLPLRAFRSPLP